MAISVKFLACMRQKCDSPRSISFCSGSSIFGREHFDVLGGSKVVQVESGSLEEPSMFAHITLVFSHLLASSVTQILT